MHPIMLALFDSCRQRRDKMKLMNIYQCVNKDTLVLAYLVKIVVGTNIACFVLLIS